MSVGHPFSSRDVSESHTAPTRIPYAIYRCTIGPEGTCTRQLAYLRYRYLPFALIVERILVVEIFLAAHHFRKEGPTLLLHKHLGGGMAERSSSNHPSLKAIRPLWSFSISIMNAGGECLVLVSYSPAFSIEAKLVV